MKTLPAAPAYGRRSAAELLPAAVRALGGPFEQAPDDVLRLPAANRVCILILDGLGAALLRQHTADAPFLASLDGEPPLTVGFPSTTATSMAGFGTGLAPGEHGMLGYQVRDPERGVLLNLLRWDRTAVPEVWQPQPTVFERVAATGLPVFHVGPAAFAQSPLTRAVWRGAEYRAADSPGSLVARTAATVAAEPRSLTVAYYSTVDGTGHVYGSRSAAWRHELAIVDRLVERLAAALPPDALLVVTGDHGMVDPSERIDLDAIPELREGVALLGGEARARHVYTVPGAAEDALAAWAEKLDGSAWVLSREAAVEAGWFGPVVRPELLGRLGDVVVAAGPDTALIATEQEPRESRLVGLHGSITPADLEVPVLLAREGGNVVAEP
ncbi:alkaline phosphatase family protein [Cryptosporangium aurantiacum]|uniref:Type I phosphodiesterase / nucleotide pyrophosphatase n=1 Tax=Cryptosporangium aurantiacum TaxID=134849 RepID=A0A1M7I336_9ACTN|nr:nucleotide pyrophosphatase/phosphodiesterase family protein [Cryptosporangium aurantiacum]SHM35164.1 Type I phosphodiesterase / nucleotide pyrophosphatase [Cryptosporangium aurantiacum]